MLTSGSLPDRRMGRDLANAYGLGRMMDPLKLLLFLVLSTVVVAYSLHSWHARQAYGLFRFLAFESLILLIVWNAGRWFKEPFSIQQIASWLIFATSTALAAHGLYLLRTVGRSRARIMEDTQTVVRIGAYRYIRHPLYSSLVLFGWGVFFKGADPVSAALALAATVFWVATARSEERFNVDSLGTEYSEYIKRTKMFVPFVF